MGFAEVLTIVFIALKLLGIIGWSWWLVLLPEIIALVFYVAAFIISVLVGTRAARSAKRFWDDF